MRKPIFSDFPLQEYILRHKKVRELMGKYNIDVLILSEEENIRYFTGYHTIYFGVKHDFQLFLLTRDDDHEGVLLLPSHLSGTANTSCIEDVRHWMGAGPSTKEDYCAEDVSIVIETLKDFDLIKGNIGMELGRGCRLGMSQFQFEEIKHRLPKAKIVDCANLLWETRSIKSKLEIEALRRACEITSKGYNAGLMALKEGISERKIGNIICAEMIKEGSDNTFGLNPWILFMQSGQYNNWCDSLPKDLILNKGDLVMIDGGASYKGYHADMVRMGCLGEPTKEQRKMYEATVAANDAAMSIIKPGVSCSRLFCAGMDVIRDFGYGEMVDERIKIGYSIGGHGIGLSLHELPIVRAENEDPLKEGMTLCLEFFVVDKLPFSETKNFILIEQTVAVTKDGYDLLTPMYKEMYIA